MIPVLRHEYQRKHVLVLYPGNSFEKFFALSYATLMRFSIYCFCWLFTGQHTRYSAPSDALPGS